ncbi:hypothetical protein GMO_04140 [Gluconobacter morbifer G707]|uniref:Uncharacterized protein n=1 Tax=Gluconobacter morbifer G707 TaxID=1088869 RepID=G6XFZ9_9PROT|nr:hypothetical protein GMO_04140 [Gluconobacter morbifer G707]
MIPNSGRTETIPLPSVSGDGGNCGRPTRAVLPPLRGTGEVPTTETYSPQRPDNA